MSEICRNDITFFGPIDDIRKFFDQIEELFNNIISLNDMLYIMYPHVKSLPKHDHKITWISESPIMDDYINNIGLFHISTATNVFPYMKDVIEFFKKANPQLWIHYVSENEKYNIYVNTETERRYNDQHLTVILKVKNNLFKFFYLSDYELNTLKERIENFFPGLIDFQYKDVDDLIKKTNEKVDCQLLTGYYFTDGSEYP